MELNAARGASGCLADRTPRPFDLTAISVQPHAVRILVLDSEVVPDLAGLPIQLLPSAHAPAFDGMSVHNPIGNIEVVDVLFANVVTAEPDVVIPVAKLLLQLGRALV